MMISASSPTGAATTCRGAFNPVQQQPAGVRGIFRVVADDFALFQRRPYILASYSAFRHAQQGMFPKYQPLHQPNIAAFIRSTTPALCDSDRWAYLCTIASVLCPSTAAISFRLAPFIAR